MHFWFLIGTSMVGASRLLISSSGNSQDLKEAWAPSELLSLLLMIAYWVCIVYLDNDIHYTKSANTYLHVDLIRNDNHYILTR